MHVQYLYVYLFVFMDFTNINMDVYLHTNDFMQTNTCVVYSNAHILDILVNIKPKCNIRVRMFQYFSNFINLRNWTGVPQSEYV